MNKTIWKKAHNLLGLASALFLVMLLVTGLMLNHPGWMRKQDAQKFEIVALDPAHPQKIFAAGRDALYVSENSGKDWQEVEMLYPPSETADIRFDPRDPSRIWLLERWGKLMVSEDGGKVWDLKTIPFDPQSKGVELRMISLGAPGRVAIVTSHGWIRSEDNGKSWDESQLRLDRPSLNRLVLSIHNGYFFGSRFVWLYDFSAVALLVLVISGFVLWQAGRSAG